MNKFGAIQEDTSSLAGGRNPRFQSPNVVGIVVLAVVAVAVLAFFVSFLTSPYSDHGPKPPRPVIHAK
jgi:hypothetical protein